MDDQSPHKQAQPPPLPQTGREDRWFYQVADDVRGPVAGAELRLLCEQGEILATTLVWHRDLVDWRPAGEVTQLLEPASAAGQTRSTAKGNNDAAADRPLVLATPMPSDTFPLVLFGLLVLSYVLYIGFGMPNMAQPAKDHRTAHEAPGPATSEPFELEVCNKSGEDPVYVAIAYFDRRRADWVARGWYPQRHGECRTVLKNLQAPVFVYAENKEGTRHWGGDRTGSTFCVHGGEAFVYPQSQCPEEDDGPVRSLKFQRLHDAGQTGKKHVWRLIQ